MCIHIHIHILYVCMYVCNVCWKKKKKKKKKRVGEHFLDFWGAYIFFDDPLG